MNKWRRSGVLLLTLNIFHTFFSFSIVDLELGMTFIIQQRFQQVQLGKNQKTN